MLFQGRREEEGTIVLNFCSLSTCVMHNRARAVTVRQEEGIVRLSFLQPEILLTKLLAALDFAD